MTEEREFSTKLSTDSFNYDFHVRTLFNCVTIDNKLDIPVCKMLINLGVYYKQCPRNARNSVFTQLLKIDLGWFNKITDQEFMHYLVTKIDKYGLKLYKNRSAD